MSKSTSRRLGPVIAVACLCAVAHGTALANTVATTNLSFSNGSQSIWGPGGSAAFGGSAYVLGNNTFGVSYSASASSGTVQSTLLSGMSARFTDTVAFDQRSDVQVGFDFFSRDQQVFGVPVPGGTLRTDLGASISVTGHLNTSLVGVPIGWNPTIVDYDYQLETAALFDAEVGARVSASDAFSPASVGIGIPSFGIGLSGGAGVDLDVRQTARLDITGVSGFITATHRDSGDRVTQALSLVNASERFLSFDLARAGAWDFSYASLSVLNSFSTQFSLDIRPFIEYGVGLFCGDLGDPDDNFGCAAEDRLITTLAGIDLFSSPELNLAYGAVNTGTAFSINVLAAPIPEPGTMALMLAGAGVLLTRRKLVAARATA